MLTPQLNRTRAGWLGLAAIALTIAVASAAYQRDAAPSAEDAAPNPAEMRTVIVPVSGMICMVCAGSVKNTLQAVHGVRKAEVDLAKHQVTVQYQHDQVSVDELARAIDELGYKAGVPAPAPHQ